MTCKMRNIFAQTLEMNPYDIEAYKILTKLQLKENDFNNAIETIKTALSECEETGDLDFLASIVFKKLEMKKTVQPILKMQ